MGYFKFGFFTTLGVCAASLIGGTINAMIKDKAKSKAEELKNDKKPEKDEDDIWGD